MLDIYKKLSELLDARERRNAILLFVMMLVMGLLEAAGVASVMPFMSIVANPEVVQTNPYLSAVYDYLEFDGRDSFLAFAGAIVFLLVVGSLLFKGVTHWAMARYAHMRNHSISTRLLRRYIERPYAWYLNRNTGDLGKTILSEVGQVTTGVLMPALQLVANGIVGSCLIILTVIVEPVIAAGAVMLLGGSYIVIYLVLQKYLSQIGRVRVEANRARFSVTQEAMGGIKDVKVAGVEEGYIRAFHKPALRFSRAQASNQIVGELPQFLMQALAFGGIILALLVLMFSREGDLGSVLPPMALFALVAARLIPVLQQTYRAVTRLRFGKPALDNLHADLVLPDSRRKGSGVRIDFTDNVEPLGLTHQLNLDDIRYTYPGAAAATLDGLTLSIEARTTVGFVGPSGAGKTSVVDLLLGLLEAESGEIRVDGELVSDSNIRRWQRTIGYVPQQIYLTDDSIAANIAFGVAPSHIDHDKVRNAAQLAGIEEFVSKETSDGYLTTVGERGVRLSGGQRQRIGIARALYHDPDVLILDEATSSLDTITEHQVMSAVDSLGTRKTIIIIAHRLSTVRNCDTIFLIESGRLRASGSYTELVEDSALFYKMAGAS